MIRVNIRNNMSEKVFVVSPETTVAAAIEQSGMTLAREIYLNGSPVSAADLNKSFAELGVESEAFIRGIAKAVNA